MNGKAFFQVGANELERVFVPEENVELKMVDRSHVGIVLQNAILLASLCCFKDVLLIAQHIINVQIVLLICAGITQYIKFVPNRNLGNFSRNLLKIYNWMGVIGH